MPRCEASRHATPAASKWPEHLRDAGVVTAKALNKIVAHQTVPNTVCLAGLIFLVFRGTPEATGFSRYKNSPKRIVAVRASVLCARCTQFGGDLKSRVQRRTASRNRTTQHAE